jgi:hypothetical protein
MSKKILMTLCCIGLMAACGFADDDVAQRSNNGNSSMTADCSSLNRDEQMFARKLSEQNRKMFCNDFSSSQRSSAMDMANQTDNRGAKMMTPDQSVMKVAKDNGMMQSKSSKSCGSCNCN